MRVLTLVPPSSQTKNVVRDLVYGCWCKGKRIAKTKFPPIYLLLISTILKNEGHKVTLIDAASEGISIEELKKIVLKKRIEAVIMLTATMTFNEDVSILSELKKSNPAMFTILYGQHVTSFPKQSLKNEAVDFIVKKEPDYIIRNLINSLDNNRSFKNIKGIGFKQNRKIIVNRDAPFIKNLDELPFPDRTICPDVEYFNPLAKRDPYTTVITSRGCSGKCTFCTSPYFYGGVYRFRSAENVVEELKLIASQGYKEVLFRDETFTVHRKRTKKICNLIIKNKLDLTWVCNARVGTIDKETMKLMKKAGCHKLKFGVESGSQKILDNIQKGIRLEWIMKNFMDAYKVGLDTHAHLILGAPGETKETINQTIDFIKKLKADTVTVGILTPYPGSKLFDEIARMDKSILKNCTSHDLSKLHTKSFYNELICDLSKEFLEKSVKRVYKSFYLRLWYILWKLKKINSFEEFKTVLRAGITTILFSVSGD